MSLQEEKNIRCLLIIICLQFFDQYLYDTIVIFHYFFHFKYLNQSVYDTIVILNLFFHFKYKNLNMYYLE